MKNTVTQKILTILAILAIIAAVVILTFAYINMFKQLKGKSAEQATTTTSSTPSKQSTPVTPVPVEGQVGAVVAIVTNPDGSIQITVDGGKTTGQKTYQLPKDQTVKFYTSATQTASMSASQLKKGNMVNVIKFPDPGHYQITGTTDNKLVDKLL
jgi:hypothetical protein